MTRSKVSQRIFECRELAEKVVQHLSRWEAVPLLTTSKALSGAASYCINSGLCRPRMLLTSSRNNMLVEINPHDGEVIAAKPAAPSGVKLAEMTYQWITGIAFGPKDHWLYVCNYQVDGIEHYHGGTLEYRGIFVSNDLLKSPEGLAFSNDFCYVGGVTHGVVAIVSLSGIILKVIDMAANMKHFPVPWGMTVVHLQNLDLLMISIDKEYEASSYKDAPDRKTGSLYTCAVYKDPGGALKKRQRFPNLTPDLQLGLSRPSGIHAELSEISKQQRCCSLFVTSMHAPVLEQKLEVLFDQKGKVQSLKLQGVRAEFKTHAQAKREQWDVRLIGDNVFVTSHIASGAKYCCVQQYDRSGRLRKLIRSEYLSEPNMLAVDY